MISPSAVDAILADLQHVKRLGTGWTARCPAHEDQVNSLKIDTGDEGQALLHCHAGCTVERIMRAIGKTTADLFPPKAATIARNGHRPHTVGTTRYELRDAFGDLIAVHVRRDMSDGKKDVHWEQPDGTTGLGGKKIADFPLYGMQHLGDAAELIIVEGEKACDAALALGVKALGTVTGASGTPGDDSLLPLIGRTVYLWPDNDDPGRAHMERIGWRLRELGQPAGEIRLLVWGKAPDKGDVADWVLAGGTGPRLRAKMSQAVAWKPHATTESGKAEQQRLLPDDPHLTDLGNAKRLVSRHGHDLRFCGTRNAWYVWDGTRWKLDESGEIERRAKETILSLYPDAAALPKDERRKLISHAFRSESAARLRAMIALAESEPGIPVALDDLDRDPWLLTVENGTLDLRSGELRTHRQHDLITRLIPVAYDPLADCPIFLTFLDRIMAGKQDVIAFLQRAVGYSLTGMTVERCLFILWGGGKNGKSTLLDTLMHVLADHAARTSTDALMAKREAGIPNDVARLKGMRFVFASEGEEGKKLAEGKIKDLTGGDVISARFMRGEWFDFRPEFKLWFGTNHKPVITGTDDAIWDRIRLIPFEVRIPLEEQDKQLKTKLLAEATGILAWAIEGCLAWQREGLGEPEVVKKATGTYRSSEDVIGRFLDERCELHPQGSVTKKAVYDAYKAWCDDNGEQSVTHKRLGMRLGELGFDEAYIGGSNNRQKIWIGISLLQGEVSNE